MREYIRVGELVHILEPAGTIKHSTYCDIWQWANFPLARKVTEFEPCELCCECQAYEIAANSERAEVQDGEQRVKDGILEIYIKSNWYPLSKKKE